MYFYCSTLAKPLPEPVVDANRNLARDLSGLGVLVTRPAHQSAGLCRLIEQCGGRALAFPAMEIRPPGDPKTAKQLLDRSWDLLVYISPNAVRFAVARRFHTDNIRGVWMLVVRYVPPR